VLQQQHGDLFYTQPPLSLIPRIYYVLDPTDTYDLLVKQRPMLEKPTFFTRSLGGSFGNGLVTSRGDFWRRQRKLMQPAFHHAHLDRYAERIVQHTQAMLATWQDGNVITIDEAMHALTFTIVMDALFSTSVVGTTAVVQQAMHALTQGFAAQSRSIALTLLPEWFPWPALIQKRRGIRTLDRLVQQMIVERRRLGEADSPPDLLSMLLFTRDEETGETMSDQQIRDELVTLYIAGHETTALLLSWTWVLLAQEPESTAALQAELAAILNDRSPNFADLPHLPITGAIIKEALRLYPPAWFISREAPAGLSVQGETIAPGSILCFFPYTIQRDSRWYDDPQTFNPTRWLDGLEQSLPKGAYFPFGLGPRICIGNGFAQMEAQLILATMAQYLQLQQLTEARVGPSITLSFTQSVQMKIQKYR
jgi:cytochrome P450